MKRINIVAFLLTLLFVYSSYQWIAQIKSAYFTPYTWSSLSTAQWIYLVIFIGGLSGFIQFFASKFKRTQLLRAYLFFLIADWLSTFTFMLLNKTSKEDVLQVTRSIAFSIVDIGIACFSLFTLISIRVPANNNDGLVNYLPASKVKRFCNRLLDLSLLSFLVFKFYIIWNTMFSQQIGSVDETFLPLLIVFQFVYYTIMEYFFHSTLGKTITNTTVINMDGTYSSPGTILLRSVCRSIPLEPFSFLFAKGWHDTLSKTVVVEETYSEEYK